MSDKKALILRCCAKDFKAIAEGKIQERYLEVKPYWETRVLEKNGDPKSYDEIHIKNGYKEDSPVAIIEYGKFHGTVEHEGKDSFKIEFGKIKEIKNY